jgi:hypothetical protein
MVLNSENYNIFTGTTISKYRWIPLKRQTMGLKRRGQTIHTEGLSAATTT